MTIFIIIVIFLIIAEAGSSSRSFKSKTENRSQLKKVNSLKQVTRQYNELLERQEAQEVERQVILKKMKQHEPEFIADIESSISQLTTAVEEPSNLQPLKVVYQETPTQAVIRELKKRNIQTIWHMTHKDNVASILQNGLKSNSEIAKDGGAVDISNQSVQALRKKPETVHNRPLHDYAPTYLNIRNPMLYVKRDCNDDICLLEISIDCLIDCEFVFTDGNAASLGTHFFNMAESVGRLPWDVLSNE